MAHKLKQLLLAAAVLIGLLGGTPLVQLPAYASATCPSTTGGSSRGQVISELNTTGITKDCDDSKVTSSVHGIVKILSFVAGVAGVIFIVIAGFKFIASGGDSNKVAAARTSLINAMIGLAIAATAQIIARAIS